MLRYLWWYGSVGFLVVEMDRVIRNQPDMLVLVGMFMY
jgi:hypothetical protein